MVDRVRECVWVLHFLYHSLLRLASHLSSAVGKKCMFVGYRVVGL